MRLVKTRNAPSSRQGLQSVEFEDITERLREAKRGEDLANDEERAKLSGHSVAVEWDVKLKKGQYENSNRVGQSG